ncbi:hypothetical protein NX059_001441 [Plenodomus lindquistii]|nr:hypothetical protein NX059_001441 [Plenodomus lindquistii]
MAPPKSVSDLPRELVDRIIECSVLDNTLDASWMMRGVSRYFREAIEDLLIHRLPALPHASDLHIDHAVLEAIIGPLLGSQIRRATRHSTFTNIEAQAEAILRVEVHTNVADMKERYMKNIIRYMSTDSKEDAIRRLFEYGGSRKNLCRPQPPEALVHLSAAAATGSLCAVRYYLQADCQWPKFDCYSGHSDCCFKLDPLHAAVSRGHLEIVEYLVTILKNHAPNDNEWSSSYENFHTTVSLSIRAGDRAMFEALAGFAKQLDMWAGKGQMCEWDWDLWLESAARSGSQAMCQSVLDSITEPYIKRRRSKQKIFLKACQFGQTVLIRRFLRQRMVTISNIGPKAMYTAVKYGHESVLDLLLESGASITEGRPIVAAIICGDVPMMKVLLSHGAKIDEEVVVRVQSRLAEIQYDGLQSFGVHRWRSLAFYFAFQRVKNVKLARKSKKDYGSLLVADVEKEYTSEKLESIMKTNQGAV